MVLVFWELFEPSLDKFVVVRSVDTVGPTAVSNFFDALAEANCSWVLEENDAGVSVPGIFVYFKLICAINLEWSNFRYKANHG